MALKSRKTTRISLGVHFSFIIFTLVSLCLNSNSALAVGNSATLPTFSDFSNIVQNGEKDILRGVYVDNVLALPVVQQPLGNAIFVSNNDGEVTQFGMASQYGNIGLLAHNHRAGKSFSEMTPGQEVQLVYGDGHVRNFCDQKSAEVPGTATLQPLQFLQESQQR